MLSGGSGGHAGILSATGDRGLKLPAKVRFLVSSCPEDAQIGGHPPQTPAFQRRPEVEPIDEYAWLTRQSGETGLLGLHRIYREKTGKFLKTRRRCMANPAPNPPETPGKQGSPALFPAARNRELNSIHQRIDAIHNPVNSETSQQRPCPSRMANQIPGK